MKKWINFIITFTTVVCIFFIGFYSIRIVKNIGALISSLHNKIEIYEQYRRDEFNRLEQAVKKMLDLTIKNDKSQLGLIEDITQNIERLEKIQSQMKKELKTKKQINLANVEQIEKANIVVYNTTMYVSGSGSHIVIKGKDYILTCAHLIKNEEDLIWGVLDDETWHPLELVKINKRKDLALFRISGVENLPYLEISNEFPTQGSEVVIVGNPDNLRDVITDGTIAKIKRNNYILTNKIYFGNSGGAILYKGKIVGVANQITVYFNFNLIVNYSSGVKLETIKEFLDIK